MPYTKAISPVSNSYLTKGKEYEIKSVGLGFFTITDDNGNTIKTNKYGCSQTHGEQWQLK